MWSSSVSIKRQDSFVEFGGKGSFQRTVPELHDLVERIVARNNLSKPRIAVIDKDMPNACMKTCQIGQCIDED